MNFTRSSFVGSSSMRRIAAAALLVACSHAARRDATPPLAAEAPEAAAQQAASAGVPPLTRDEMVDHLLSRITYGARPQDRERVARIGISAFVEEQLHPEEIDDAAAEQQLARFDVLRDDTGALVQKLVAERRVQKQQALLTDAPPAPEGERAEPLAMSMRPKREFVQELAQARIVRAVSSGRQLQEVMADFWFNHFNVFAGKADEAALLPAYDEQVIRRNALGTFPALLEAVAHSPAMLVYLDNWRSAAPRPRRQRGINENYARELLELHTLGVDGGYTQQDIVEVARCYTGWTVADPRTDPRFVFRPGMHDFGPKVVLGHRIPGGRGVEDGEEVLRILEQHPATARFIARKLARRFVSDDPPESLVDRIAATYARTGGDIRSMLRALFESPEFWSRRAAGAKVRSPLELVAGSVRALGATVDDPAPLARAVARIGEPLYAAQPPTGYVDRAETWLASGALLARIDFGLQLAGGRIDGVRVDLSSVDAPTPEQVLEKAAARLGAEALSPRTRESVLAELRKAPPRAAPARAVGLLLGAPELQRR